MKKEEILKLFRQAFGLDPVLPKKEKFAIEAVTVDGIKIAADVMEIGQPLVIMAEDGTTSPAPEGTYITDKATIVVDASGMIASIAPIEEVAAADEVVPAKMDPAKMLEAINTIMDELTAIQSAVKSLTENMSKAQEELKETNLSIEKFSKAPGTPRVTRTDNTPTSKVEERTSQLNLADQREEEARLSRLAKYSAMVDLNSK